MAFSCVIEVVLHSLVPRMRLESCCVTNDSSRCVTALELLETARIA